MRAAFLILVIAGCSDGSDGKSQASSNSFSGSCCLNQIAYTCATMDAFQRCIGFDAGKCHAGCGVDVACHTKCDQMAQTSTQDASGCSRNPSGDGQCSITSSGSCKEVTSNPSCAANVDCSTGHCAHGRCYPDTIGSLCNADSECASGNCTQGCCQGNSFGSPCAADIQCDSGSCSGGTCD